MSEMKLIMERWDQFVEQSDNTLNLLLEGKDDAAQVASLKKDPNRVAKLVQQASEEKDKEKLTQLARILMTDPEIKAAAEVISLIPTEIEKAQKEEPDLTEIDFLDNAGVRTTGAVGRVLEKPGVKKILGLGGATMILGAVVAMVLAPAIGLDPQIVQTLFGVGGSAVRCAGATDGTDCLSSIIGAVGEEMGGVDVDLKLEQERKKT